MKLLSIEVLRDSAGRIHKQDGAAVVIMFTHYSFFQYWVNGEFVSQTCMSLRKKDRCIPWDACKGKHCRPTCDSTLLSDNELIGYAHIMAGIPTCVGFTTEDADVKKVLEDVIDKVFDERATLSNRDVAPIAVEKSDAEHIAVEKSDAEPTAVEKSDAELIAVEKSDAEPIAVEKSDAEKPAASNPQEPQEKNINEIIKKSKNTRSLWKTLRREPDHVIAAALCAFAIIDEKSNMEMPPMDETPVSMRNAVDAFYNARDALVTVFTDELVNIPREVAALIGFFSFVMTRMSARSSPDSEETSSSSDSSQSGEDENADALQNHLEEIDSP